MIFLCIKGYNYNATKRTLTKARILDIHHYKRSIMRIELKCNNTLLEIFLNCVLWLSHDIIIYYYVIWY